MKKKLLTCLCICLLIAVSETAFAAGGSGSSSQASDTTGGRITLGTMTYDPSPSVLMAVKDTTTAYAIKATNSLTDKSNGMEYGTTSAATGYAQRTKTVDAATAVPVPTDAATLDGSGWVWMGGSGS